MPEKIPAVISDGTLGGNKVTILGGNPDRSSGETLWGETNFQRNSFKEIVKAISGGTIGASLEVSPKELLKKSFEFFFGLEEIIEGKPGQFVEDL